MNQFVRKIGNPRNDIMIYTDALMARGDMEMVDPDEAAEILGFSASTTAVATVHSFTKTGDDNSALLPDERMVKIVAAIALIPPEQWGKAFGGKPAMPKVGDVSAAVGFKVSADDIKAAVTSGGASAPGAGPATETAVIPGGKGVTVEQHLRDAGLLAE